MNAEESFSYRWMSDVGHYGCDLLVQLEDDGLTIVFSDECGNDYQHINAKGVRALTAWLIERGFGVEAS